MVKVCFDGAQPPPVIECTDDTACPVGQFCDAQLCTFECRTDADCDGTCSPRGQCLGDEPGGGCCNTSPEPPLWLLGLLLLLRRRG